MPGDLNMTLTEFAQDELCVAEYAAIARRMADVPRQRVKSGITGGTP
jgi:hypothetical protein